MKAIRTIRLTDEEVEALETLFQRLDIEPGQRGTYFNAGIRWLAETASAAMAETVASLEIAAGCASGGDWDELTVFTNPKYGDE